MNEFNIKITKLMDLKGITTYTLIVNEEMVKQSNDLGEIKRLADTLEDGFKAGDMTESIIYSNTLQK